jgi:hypothetical protein
MRRRTRTLSTEVSFFFFFSFARLLIQPARSSFVCVGFVFPEDWKAAGGAALQGN